MAKNLKCGKGIDRKILIGTGVLSWPKIERNNSSYGAVKLMKEGTNSLLISR